MKREVQYDLNDMVEISPTPDLNLPDIQATKCLHPKDNSPYLVFLCEPKGKYVHGCRQCGSIDYIGNGTTAEPRIVHDINIGMNRVDLVITVPRYRCKDCGAAFRHEFDSVPERTHCTNRLYEQLRREVFTRPFTDVAADFGYTEATIRNIFDEFANELEASRPPIVAPLCLGIDEKHINHAMRGVFVDVQTGRLLEMTADNKGTTVASTIESMVDYDKNIKYVTTDMANGYRAQIQYCLPYAKQIVDKYHVYQDLYHRVTKAKTGILEYVGTQIENETNPAEAEHKKAVRDLIIHNAYLFKFGKKKLTEKTRRVAIMADVCKTFPEFNHLRLIKEGFERIYEEATDRAQAEKLYEEWTALIPPTGVRKIADWEKKYGVPASLYDELRGFYNTTKSWHTEIFNYFDPGCQFTNAASEGTNSMIQRINEQGAGYGFNRLRAKALYWSNVGGRTSYSIKTNRTPIYSSVPSSISDMNYSGSYHDIGPSIFGHKRIIGYTESAEIIQDPVVPHKAVSVMAYIPDDDYYDFEEA